MTLHSQRCRPFPDQLPFVSYLGIRRDALVIPPGLVTSVAPADFLTGNENRNLLKITAAPGRSPRIRCVIFPHTTAAFTLLLKPWASYMLC